MIRAENVHKSFGSKQVLRGVNCQFEDKSKTVVIGPSGCGKSTILRIILRLIDPTQGFIEVDGQNILDFNPVALEAYRSQIGMVFQSAALFDSLKVWENVGFTYLENSKKSRQEIKKIAEEKLSWVGLDGSSDLFPSELSGGMQKRVGIARAIAQNPKILLYDEPTTGLDPVTSTVIEDLINNLQDLTGGISIVVTHQISTIFRTADQIIMFYEGQVLGQGTPDAMKNSSNLTIRNFLEGKIT